MKKYTSLGELLLDYRKVNGISQNDFAATLNIDVRTVQRWEKNITLVRSEKEDLFVQETLLPRQLVRNLNSLVAIPTYYDFRIRKYALNEISNPLPDANIFNALSEITTKRIRKINFKEDIDYIIRYKKFQKTTSNIVNREVIREAIKLLPDLNLIITDESGYYSGHSVILPIKFETYKKFKNREISESQLTVKDLVDIKKQSNPVYHEYDISADCNDNIKYIAISILKYFRNKCNNNYIYSAFSTRYDSLYLSKQLGLETVWVNLEEQKKLGLEEPQRFVEGNFKKFFSN